MGWNMALLVPTVQISDFSNDLRKAFDTVRLFRGMPDNGWQTVRKIPLSTLQEAQTANRVRELLESEISNFLADTGELDWLLSIPPIGPEGFAVDLRNNDGQFSVLFGELEEGFELLSDALTWISRALSDAYQLRITLVGGRRREWTLEPVTPPYNPNEWKPILASGHFVAFRSLRSITSLICRNRFAGSRDVAT